MASSPAQTGPTNKAIRRRVSRYDGGDVLTFVIPCLQFVHVNLIGVLDGSDLLLLASFIALAFESKLKLLDLAARKFLIMGSLWLASQCVTDVVRHTAFADYARGWSTIVMTLINFAVLYTLLAGHPRRLAIYGWGFVVGGLVAFFFFPNDYAVNFPWKFGLAIPVTWAVFLFASRESCRGYWPIMIGLMMGAVNMGLGARSLGGFCLATSLYLLLTNFLRQRRGARTRFGAGTFALLTISLVAGIAGILWAYQRAAESGFLGEDARSEYEGQASGKYGVLLGGRTELLASIPAIYDSPVLGHGSWPKDPRYLIQERQALAMLGYTVADDISAEDLEEGLIPTHSYLFGAWVNGGILGALFWIWIFALTARALLRIYPLNSPMLPMAVFAALSMLWDLLFSPYGTLGRIIVPYFVVLLMTCVDLNFHKSLVAAAANRKGKPIRRIAVGNPALTGQGSITL